MKRLGKLDFSHDSPEFEELTHSKRGGVKEIAALQGSFHRLSRGIEVFARFVPETVVRNIVRGDAYAGELHVEPRTVTIMFSDVRDFTSIAESLSQHDLLALLTKYFSCMTHIIERYEGVVSEILGDGLLAFWNTPDDVENHAAKGVAASLAQQRALGSLNEELESMGLPAVAIRIGLHSGAVLSGNFGSEVKMKFGCMGDPVDLAADLESMCKQYGVGVLISQATLDAMSVISGFVSRRIDLIQWKGKNTAIYEVMSCDGSIMEGCEDGAPPDLFLKKSYEAALDAYQTAQFPRAAMICQELLQQRPDDLATKKLLSRASEFLDTSGRQVKSPPTHEPWTGVLVKG